MTGSIREGLKKLGVERVRKAVDAGALERDELGIYKGRTDFCHCFLGKALGITTLTDQMAIAGKCCSDYVEYDVDFTAISHAHYINAQELADEVTIFLAEHGEAVEALVAKPR